MCSGLNKHVASAPSARAAWQMSVFPSCSPSFFHPLLQPFCKADYFSAHIDLDCFSISSVDAFSYPLEFCVGARVHLQNRKGKTETVKVSLPGVMPHSLYTAVESPHNDQSHGQLLELVCNRGAVGLLPHLIKHNVPKGGVCLGEREFSHSRYA